MGRVSGIEMNTDLFGNPISDVAATAPAKRDTAISKKQRAVLLHLHHNGTITLDEAVELIGRNIYHNAHKHTGAVLSNMVRRGLIRRTNPGNFAKK